MGFWQKYFWLNVLVENICFQQRLQFLFWPTECPTPQVVMLVDHELDGALLHPLGHGLVDEMPDLGQVLLKVWFIHLNNTPAKRNIKLVTFVFNSDNSPLLVKILNMGNKVVNISVNLTRLVPDENVKKNTKLFPMQLILEPTLGGFIWEFCKISTYCPDSEFYHTHFLGSMLPQYMAFCICQFR